MSNYNTFCTTEAEKYDLLRMIRTAGATVTNVSACGSGYYIQLTATLEQAREIDRMIDESEGMTA